MKRRYFIIAFIFLFIIASVAIFSNQSSEASLSKDKARAAVQSVIKEIGNKVNGPAATVIEKVKEVATLGYEEAIEKGKGLVSAAIVEPTKEITKDLIKKALSVASSSFLTSEDVKEILKNDNCNCR